MLSYLKGRNVRRLDLAVNTALDNEKALGASRVLKKIPCTTIMMPEEGQYTPNLMKYAKRASRVFTVGQRRMLSVHGIQLELIPCSCGYACKIDAGGASLLKINENCVIMKTDLDTQGVLRGWTLVKARAGSRKMRIFFDGDRTTVYRFRRQEVPK